MTGLMRSRTGFSHTDSQIMRIARMTFEVSGTEHRLPGGLVDGYCLQAQFPPTVLALAFLIEFKLE